jgi:hypothetical protein
MCVPSTTRPTLVNPAEAIIQASATGVRGSQACPAASSPSAPPAHRHQEKQTMSGNQLPARAAKAGDDRRHRHRRHQPGRVHLTTGHRPGRRRQQPGRHLAGSRLAPAPQPGTHPGGRHRRELSNTPIPPGGSAMRTRLTINGASATARLDDTATARDFASLLPVTVTLSDLGGREKAGALPRALVAGEGQSGYRTGQLGYWSPSRDLAIYYHQDGFRIPSPGIVMIGEIESGLEVISGATDDASVHITAAG